MMRTTKIKAILIILACIIVVILSIIQNYSTERLAYTMLVVVLLFYIIGSILIGIVNKSLKSEKPKEQEKLDDTLVAEANKSEQKKSEIDSKTSDKINNQSEADEG